MWCALEIKLNYSVCKICYINHEFLVLNSCFEGSNYLCNFFFFNLCKFFRKGTFAIDHGISNHGNSRYGSIHYCYLHFYVPDTKFIVPEGFPNERYYLFVNI